MEDTSPKPCPYCGEPMGSGYIPRKQCGKPECKRAYNNERARRWNREHPGYRKKYPQNNDIYPHTCERCGAAFKSHKKVQRYCGVECLKLSQAERRERERQKRLPVSLHAPCTPLPSNHPTVVLQRPEYKRLFIGGRCERCGGTFLVHSEIGVATYCSKTCAHAAAGDRRRTAERGAGGRHNRIAVFERDGWRCHICGKLTKRGAHYLDPLAPTIDHLVPVSDGGHGNADNVACAHRHCNTKRNTRGSAQLLLIG